jgi:hypothetical protein
MTIATAYLTFRYLCHYSFDIASLHQIGNIVFFVRLVVEFQYHDICLPAIYTGMLCKVLTNPSLNFDNSLVRIGADICSSVWVGLIMSIIICSLTHLAPVCVPILVASPLLKIFQRFSLATLLALLHVCIVTKIQLQVKYEPPHGFEPSLFFFTREVPFQLGVEGNETILPYRRPVCQLMDKRSIYGRWSEELSSAKRSAAMTLMRPLTSDQSIRRKP